MNASIWLILINSLEQYKDGTQLSMRYKIRLSTCFPQILVGKNLYNSPTNICKILLKIYMKFY